jgi:hypothetical protein
MVCLRNQVFRDVTSLDYWFLSCVLRSFHPKLGAGGHLNISIRARFLWKNIHIITPRNRVIFETLTVPQLVKKFYGTKQFITAF